MKKIIIVLISAVNCYAMEPKIDSSRILCTHENIHRDLLKEHTAKYGLDPEDANKWNKWKQIPGTIQKSLCNYYYDQQYQSYQDGCKKKGWTEGSVSSLLKFIGIPSDDTTEPYDTVPTIQNTRTIMPKICFLKQLTSSIPLAIQQTHIKELLDGTKYMQQYHLSKITPQRLLADKNNSSVSSLTCNNNYVFAGFYNGIITIWDASQIYQPIIKRSYKAHDQAVEALLSLQKYLVSSANNIKIWNQETGHLHHTLAEDLRIEHALQVNHLCALGENHFVSTTKDGTLSVWNVTTGTKTHTHPLPLINVHALSCSKNHIIVAGSLALAQHDGTILFIKKETPTVVDQMYKYISQKINTLIYSDSASSFIAAESNEILFFDHSNFPEYQNVILTSQIKPFNTHPITDLILFNDIGLYSANNKIKTFNKVNNEFLTSSLLCQSEPTKLAQFQEDFFLSGHSNGDIVLWTPENYFEIVYKASSMPEIALLQLAYQPTTERGT